MNRSLWDILIRAFAAIAVLCLCGIILKLLRAALSGALPSDFMTDLSAGYGLLRAQVSPALAPIFALLIVGVCCFIILGKRR